MDIQDFAQAPPELGNQYDEDRVLRSYLARVLPGDVLGSIESELVELGGRAGGELWRAMLGDLPNEPRLTRWSAWGERVDAIELTAHWRTMETLAARHGLVAAAYERAHGAFSRVHQFAMVHLVHPSSDVYTCPLAMTDGAAKTLHVHGNRQLLERAIPRLTSRDPSTFWTSGQWMTETSGGSDVGRSITEARQGSDGVWRLYGRKWFTSAATSQMALTLGRPEGNGPGGRGLALFYVECFDDEGRLRNIRIERLKDKLGTRKLPTAELFLEGTPAVAVAGTENGVRNITPMLNITRLWNSVSAVSFMRRGIALARDYARRRVAFAAPLAEQPLHLDTVAGLQAEYEGAFHLTFRVVELLGREEAGEIGAEEALLLRVLTPVAKLTTGRQAVAGSTEALETFGGAGYLEDTGVPVLVRDAQVLPVWEGTTNVLALDTLRALREEGTFGAVAAEVGRCAAAARDALLVDLGNRATRTIERAGDWLERTSSAGADGRAEVEAGARRFAMTLGRAAELALLVRHAQWSLDHERDARARAAARRFALHGIDLLADADREESRALADDRPLPVAEPVGSVGR